MCKLVRKEDAKRFAFDANLQKKQTCKSGTQTGETQSKIELQNIKTWYFLARNLRLRFSKDRKKFQEKKKLVFFASFVVCLLRANWFALELQAASSLQSNRKRITNQSSKSEKRDFWPNPLSAASKRENCNKATESNATRTKASSLQVLFVLLCFVLFSVFAARLNFDWLKLQSTFDFIKFGFVFDRSSK